MKTTVELPDALFRKAKQYAAKQGMPLREVIARGLHMVLDDAPARRKGFRMKSITTKGKGLVADGSWSTIRSLIYEERGG